MPEPIRLALVWHMHQPSYRDGESGKLLLPWARLHATKDYGHMAALLARYPRVHATFNLTPILLEQLDGVAAGETDRYLDVARISPERLTEAERRFLVDRFFDVHPERMIEPHGRYRELRDLMRGAGDSAAIQPQDLRDLQVWFHLAWTDPVHRREEPLGSLFQKERGFSEREKHTLLDWGIRFAGSIGGAYRDLAKTGQIEIATSAYHHPILPLLIDSDAPRENSATIALPDPPFRAPEDAEEQIRRAARAHRLRFGDPPRGAWPPEGAVSQATLAALAAAGFQWAASDETVLAAAIAGREGEYAAWPAPLYQAHRVETEAGPVAMVFRDRKLSDLIGFTYAHWNPRHAAEDFVRRLRETRACVGEDESPLVAVILDGENCWESYADDGNPFLNELYELLTAATDIESVTVSEGLERVPPRSRLDRIPVGSWIRADLGIWVGHPEKNRAWGELSRARQAVADSTRAGNAAAAAAWDDIYAAEASDWLWWYGEDHPTDHRHVLDRLFRARLISACRRIGVAPPAALLQSLRLETAGAGEAGQPDGFLAGRPDLDGLETDFFEWKGAIHYDPAGAAGSMHLVSSTLRAVRFGTDGQNLYLMLGLETPGASNSDVSIAVLLSGGEERLARVPLGAGGRGKPEWARLPPAKSTGDLGEYAIDRVVEVRIPFQAFEETPVRFRVLVERQGEVDEVAPHSGWFELRLRPDDPEISQWSAL